MHRVSALILLVACWLAPIDAHGQELGKDWKLEAMEWSSPVDRIETVTIKNHYGAVRVGGASGDLAGIVELHGMIQRHDDDPREPVVVREISDGAFEVEVTYPGDGEVASPPDAWRKRRIDITIYATRDSRLRVETLHDDIIVKGFVGAIEARSESGKIQLKTAGPVDALSKYGEIETFFVGTELPAQFKFETLTGPIHLSLPWEIAPRAVLETRGEISSDFSVDIEWLAGSTLKRGTVDASKADPFTLSSYSGNIRLLRRIDNRRTAPLPSTVESSEKSP